MHVDHGKSALVKALTGTDPDRLPEEKRRQITIDLGFAALNVTAPNGDRIHAGIVDVPGHEDFVRNMAPRPIRMPTPAMVKPRDESVRARFATELDRNFSVVASAGSGKTTGIIERILSIARSPNAAEILPRLVVVTFTNRAADEMQQRTRQALLQENLGQEVQTAFNRAFFGTIHSFCMKLLTDFGHYLGLPAPLELVEDDEDLWQEFAQNQTRIGRSLGEKDRAMCGG